MRRVCKSSIMAIGLIILAGLVAGCGIDAMEKLSQDVEIPDVAVREQAIRDLANLRDSRAVETLVDVLGSDEEMYDRAAVALVKKGRDLSGTRKVNPVVEKVMELMAKGHVGEAFRARGAWVLGEIGDRTAIPALKTAAGLGQTLSLLVDQANYALEKLGYTSVARVYEIPWGNLRGTVEVLPLIEPIPPIPSGETSG